jgi:APA family basic amino acid/polyamine antiporter
MNFLDFFLKKPISQIQEESSACELKRSLSALNLISLGIGCIIGAGIFAMTGVQAAQYAGPAILISFVMAGVACAFAALCYAELASTLPVSGSAYTYAYATLGELIAWIMGWLLILEYGVAASTVAVSWAGYFVSFMRDVGVHIPDAYASSTLLYNNDVAGTGGFFKAISMQSAFNFPAFNAVILLTFLLTIGIKESATVNNVIVVIKLIILVLLVVMGFGHIDTANWHPFIPQHIPHTERYGWPGILHAGAVISFAYVGFEAVSTAAQEARNPQRDMPIGILGSLGICTMLYILVAMVLTGVVSYTKLNVADPLAVAVDVLHIGWLIWLVKIGAIVGLFSVMLVLLYGQTRIFFSMGRDGLLPGIFSKVHPRFQTPHINTVIVGLLTGLVAGFTPIDILGDLVSLGTLMAFAIVCFSVLWLRYKRPDMERAFKVPLFPVTPVLGIMACVWLMWGIRNMMELLFIYYFPVGLVIYFVYSHRNSRMRALSQESAKPAHLFTPE